MILLRRLNYADYILAFNPEYLVSNYNLRLTFFASIGLLNYYICNDVTYQERKNILLSSQVRDTQ